MYVLLTPAPNTARSFNGKTLSGGRHYVLVQKNEVTVRNALAQGTMVILEGFEHTGAFISQREIDKLVRELATTRVKEENETYEEYRGNLYRFAVESLASGNDEDEVDAEAEKPATKKRTPTKAATAAAAADAAKTTDESTKD